MNDLRANHDYVDQPLPATTRIAKARAGGGAVTMLSAAMLAVGEILEPEKAQVEIQQPADARDNDGFDLAFGALPPLD